MRAAARQHGSGADGAELMDQAARVLTSMLNGHSVEQIHDRRPEWKLSELRLIERELGKLQRRLAAMMDAAVTVQRRPSMRNGT